MRSLFIFGGGFGVFFNFLIYFFYFMDKEKKKKQNNDTIVFGLIFNFDNLVRLLIRISVHSQTSFRLEFPLLRHFCRWKDYCGSSS